MKFAWLLGLILLTGCDRTYITVPSPTAPSAPEAPVITSYSIELRITGNANSVRVKYINPVDGLTQLTTTLPYFASFRTNQDTIFLSLEATPISYPATVDFPFLSVQIFVNGSLFREASSASLFLSTISVSGTYRR